MVQVVWAVGSVAGQPAQAHLPPAHSQSVRPYVQFGPSPAHPLPSAGCCVGQTLQRQLPLKPHEHWVVPQVHTLPGSSQGDMFAGAWVGHTGPPLLELLAAALVVVVDPLLPPRPLLELTAVVVVPPLLELTPAVVDAVALNVPPLPGLVGAPPSPPVPAIDPVLLLDAPPSPPVPELDGVSRMLLPHAGVPTTKAIPRHATI
jgi:hypothetical protein